MYYVTNHQPCTYNSLLKNLVSLCSSSLSPPQTSFVKSYSATKAKLLSWNFRNWFLNFCRRFLWLWIRKYQNRAINIWIKIFKIFWDLRIFDLIDYESFTGVTAPVVLPFKSIRKSSKNVFNNKIGESVFFFF